MSMDYALLASMENRKVYLNDNERVISVPPHWTHHETKELLDKIYQLIDEIDKKSTVKIVGMSHRALLSDDEQTLEVACEKAYARDFKFFAHKNKVYVVCSEDMYIEAVCTIEGEE